MTSVFPPLAERRLARPRAPATTPHERIAELEYKLSKMEKINAVLIDRVERSIDSQASAFSLFQTAIGLERQVRERTDELTRTLRKLEAANNELVRARDDANEANRSKTRFLAACGHDLLQPLNAARLAGSALAELQVTSDGQRLSKQVDRALTTIESLLRTILDISKLDAGAVEAQEGPVCLDDVLADLESDFAPLAAAKNLDLRVKRHDNVWVLTDSLMLRRILQNLISNAVRYTQSGGVLIGARRRGETVLVDVIDTGPGIPEDQIGLIFDEFHRGAGASASGDIGLGLGLSIVRRLVSALQAHELSLQSRLGHGTRFSLRLPRIEAQEQPPAELSVARSLQGFGLSGALIVVVENDESVREATAALLERWCCDVIAAPSAKAAAALLRACDRRPDAIVADYHLDDGEIGLDAIASLRADHHETIPALVVTADYGDAVADAVAETGVELLHKPVKPAELRALLAHLLAG